MKSVPRCVVVLAAMVAPAVVADTVHAPFPREAHEQANVFMHMFPGMPPFAQQSDAMRNAVQLMGAKGGMLDAQDNLTDPIQSILNQPVFSPNNLDNPAMTAGVTFFGQFLDHDITFDLRSRLLERADPSSIQNFRSAAFDLDTLYGGGPERSPELYVEAEGAIWMRIEPIPGSEAVSRRGALRYDVPRGSGGVAILGDSRNDENIVISQLHLAMLRFHNAVTVHLRGQPEHQGASPRDLFARARRLVQWHYQWCIVHEYLPMTIGQERLDRLLRSGTSYYAVDYTRPEHRSSDARQRWYEHREATPTKPQIPIEFSVAAFRFGHSQIRPSYRLNFGPDGGQPFFAFVFEDTIDPASPDPGDLRGGKRAPRRFVDWQTFFDFGDGNSRPNKRIDTKISSVVMELPGARVPAAGLPTDGVQSLPSRNLMRHVNFGLPSGQAIARRMDLPVLSATQLAELAPYGMQESTPLWFYVLKEAELMEEGRRLGPVGARIVGEVFVGLLKADRSSYLTVDPQWTPTLPSKGGPGSFRITDLLNFAGVVPPLQ